MAAPFNDLQSKGEAALKALLQTALTAAGDSTEIVTGLGMDDDLPLPVVVAEVQQGDEDIEGTGNFWLLYAATVTTQADPDDGQSTSALLLAHRARVAYIVDAVLQTSLATDLSSQVSDFTVQGVRSFRCSEQRFEARHVSTQIDFEGLTCGSDL